MLAEIKRARNEAAAAQREAEEARAQAERLRRELEERLTKVEEDRRQILNAARRQARMELSAVRKELQNISKALKPPHVRPQRVVEARAKLKEVEETVEPPEPRIKPFPLTRDKLRVGQIVWVEELQSKGEISDFLSDEEVEVRVGKFRVKATLHDLDLVEEEIHGEPEDTSVEVTSPPPPPAALQLRGHRAEEAIMELDKYLNKASVARMPRVRIVHGKGTGTLRRVVREELQKHPLVASYRPGAPEEGGDGVTIARLS